MLPTDRQLGRRGCVGYTAASTVKKTNLPVSDTEHLGFWPLPYLQHGGYLILPRGITCPKPCCTQRVAFMADFCDLSANLTDTKRIVKMGCTRFNVDSTFVERMSAEAMRTDVLVLASLTARASFGSLPPETSPNRRDVLVPASAHEARMDEAVPLVSPFFEML